MTTASLKHTRFLDFETPNRGKLDLLQYRGPPRGFGDSGRKAIYFQGFGENGLFFFRDLGRKRNFLGY